MSLSQIGLALLLVLIVGGVAWWRLRGDPSADPQRGGVTPDPDSDPNDVIQ